MGQFRRRSPQPRRTAEAAFDPALDTPGWSRRSFITGTLGLGAAVAFGACGGDDDTTTTSTTGAVAATRPAPSTATAATTPAPTTTASGPDATVEITDLLGTRHLPAAPGRVVCLDGRNDLELAMLCEWPVVGYYDRSTETVPYPADLVAAVADAESLPFEPNLEQLAALRPDLIILVDEYWVDEIGRDRLESIAPLLVTIHDPELGQAGWREEFSYFLDAFGKADRIDEYLDRYDTAIADVRERWSETIEATALALVQLNSSTGDIVIHAPETVLIGAVVQDLGGHFGSFQTSLAEAELLAAENLGDVDADCIVRSSYTLEAGAFEALDNNPLWAAMPAVQRGAVVETALLIVNFGGPVLALACVELLGRTYELAAATAA